MIQFSIDSFSNGISGRPYKSINEAIQDGGYSVWCNEKIKLAFSFGNGTEKDFKRYCKDNKCKIISVSIHTPTQGVTLYLITYYKSANLIHCYANHHYYSTS